MRPTERPFTSSRSWSLVPGPWSRPGSEARSSEEPRMSTPVVMPQMGESIAEGTIVRWIKKVGDSVDRDEPLFEISTDKVDAEIPSPAAGVLLEIAVKEGETVPVNSVVATIGAAGEKAAAAAPAAAPADAAVPEAAVGQPDAPPRPPAVEPAPAPAASNGRPQRSSPLVRRIAKEHGVDIGRISGTGAGGRVTKHDILEHLEKGPPSPARLRRGSLGGDRRRRAGRPAAPALPARRARRNSADVGDAQEDRRAHGAQQAHLGARLLGVRGHLHARRGAAQGAQGRVRAAGRQAHASRRSSPRRWSTPCAATR